MAVTGRPRRVSSPRTPSTEPRPRTAAGAGRTSAGTAHAAGDGGRTPRPSSPNWSPRGTRSSRSGGLEGIHRGDVFGVPGHGKPLSGVSISTLTIRDGKVVRYRVLPDRLRIHPAAQRRIGLRGKTHANKLSSTDIGGDQQNPRTVRARLRQRDEERLDSSSPKTSSSRTSSAGDTGSRASKSPAPFWRRMTEDSADHNTLNAVILVDADGTVRVRSPVHRGSSPRTGSIHTTGSTSTSSGHTAGLADQRVASAPEISAGGVYRVAGFVRRTVAAERGLGCPKSFLAPGVPAPQRFGAAADRIDSASSRADRLSTPSPMNHRSTPMRLPDTWSPHRAACHRRRIRPTRAARRPVPHASRPLPSRAAR